MLNLDLLAYRTFCALDSIRLPPPLPFSGIHLALSPRSPAPARCLSPCPRPASRSRSAFNQRDDVDRGDLRSKQGAVIAICDCSARSLRLPRTNFLIIRPSEALLIEIDMRIFKRATLKHFAGNAEWSFDCRNRCVR